MDVVKFTRCGAPCATGCAARSSWTLSKSDQRYSKITGLVVSIDVLAIAAVVLLAVDAQDDDFRQRGVKRYTDCGLVGADVRASGIPAYLIVDHQGGPVNGRRANSQL